MNNNWQTYPLISTQLKAVNHCIQERISCRDQALHSALLTMANNGGKYLRPALLLLVSRLFTTNSKGDERLVKLAASIEVLHMATLIHDDIIDDSPERRGAVSIQARFGKDTAVYAGDLLFTIFFDLLLEAIPSSNYLAINAQAMRQILDGELGQMGQRFNLQQGLSDYLANVKGKTAALFKLAAQEGAYFAGANADQVRTAADFGQQLGIAFQMLDDILDYTGDKRLNKPVLEDLATGVYSLPLLMALQIPTTAKQVTPLLVKGNQLTKPEIHQVQRIVVASGAVEKSRQLAGQYTRGALTNLTEFPATKSRRFLQQMTNRLLKRSN